MWSRKETIEVLIVTEFCIKMCKCSMIVHHKQVLTLYLFVITVLPGKLEYPETCMPFCTSTLKAKSTYYIDK